MAKLRNLRAYVPGTNETPDGISASGYDTGTGNAILRKINLNVDIATQNELNEAFVQLSSAISSSSDGWKQADIQLSNDLKAWATGNELSGALHNEITAEANRAETAEEAIRADLSNNYKVSVVKADSPETSAYAATYYVTQGGVKVGENINIPKDYVVKSAALSTVTEAGVPYPEAQVGDKYIDFVVNTADQGDEKHIYLPVKDLVDVYTGGTTQFATVTVDANRVITTNVSADLISAAAVTKVVGTAEDLSTADTINGVRAYVDEQVAEKNVSAVGDVYVSATAANNTVTVAATQALSNAVELANSAVQTVNGDVTYLTATENSNGVVTVSATPKLTAAVTYAENALQSISKGTDGTYVTTTIGTKDDNKNQTVGVAVTVAALTAGTNGLAEATDVKQYVDNAVSSKNVAAEGDDLVNATAANNKVTVQATDALCAVVSKVEGTSATWDGALQSVEGGSTTYATVSVSNKASNKQTISATVLTHTVADATSIADGLATASDVKAYVDTVSAAIAVTATGDDYVSAWVENGKDIKLAAKAKLTDVVAAVETSANTWNSALQTADITAGSANGTIAVKGSDVAITGLQSAAYTLSTAYDKAGDAAALQTAIKAAVNDTRFDSEAADDYTDIDAIIADLIKVRRALGALKALNVTLTPAVQA